MKKEKCTYFILILFGILSFATSNEDIIDISPYQYPQPTSETDEDYNIAIMSTNDVHGAFFHRDVDIHESETYKSGGLIYIGKYISELRKKWNNRFIWLDGGDQFQGGLETRLSGGKIMSDFYRIMEVDGCTLGNHEFDYGPEYLKERMTEVGRPYIVSNIKSKITGSEEFLPNQTKSKIYQMGEIKLGVIGLTTVTTAQTSSGDISEFQFLPYIENISKESQKLKDEGCHAILLLAHIGIDCYDHTEAEKYNLELRDINTVLPKCNEKNELGVLLNSIPKGLVDVVISAHNHDIVHQWILGYPVISNVNSGRYANLMYLYFKKVDGKYVFQKEKTLLEGPLPACEKIFTGNKRCDPLDKKVIPTMGELKYFKFHDFKIEKEEKLVPVFDKYWDEYQRYLTEILTTTDHIMEVLEEEEGALGNLYTDFVRRETGADVSILNVGSFRVTWSPGKISVADVFDMSPFENKITSYDMTGVELRRMLFSVQAGARSFYPTSGIIQVVSKKPAHKLIEVKLFDGYKEYEIEDTKVYRVASNEFIMPYGGDAFRKVKSWYTPTNLVIHFDFRDALIKFLKYIDKIETEKFVDLNHPRLRFQDKEENEDYKKKEKKEDNGEKEKNKIPLYNHWRKTIS